MQFENSELIQWEEGEKTITSEDSILGAVPYLNPPKSFTLRGIRYVFTAVSKEFKTGELDGVTFFCAYNPDRTMVWVSEQVPGEFIERFIPISMANDKRVFPNSFVTK